MILILNHLKFNDFDYKAQSKSFHDILLVIIKLFHGLDETLIDYSLQEVNFVVTYNLQRTKKLFIKSILAFDIYILKLKY